MRNTKPFLSIRAAILLSVYLAACNSSKTGFPSPQVKLLNGKIIATESRAENFEAFDVANADILVVDSGQSTTSDDLGRFDLVDVENSDIKITLRNGFGAYYSIEISGNVNEVDVDFILSPISARSSSELVVAKPAVEFLGRLGAITFPENGTSVVCIDHAIACSVTVGGTASGAYEGDSPEAFLYIAARNASTLEPYRLVSVTPPSFFGSDSDWEIMLDIRNITESGIIGEKFEILVATTSTKVESYDSRLFESLEDIENLVHISSVKSVTIENQ